MESQDDGRKPPIFVGIEDEWRGTEVSSKPAKKGTDQVESPVRYSEPFATSRKNAKLPQLKADGSDMEMVKTSWPKMSLTFDQVNAGKKSAIIEIVFGPLNARDVNALDRQGRVRAELEAVISQNPGSDIQEVVEIFNDKMKELGKTDKMFKGYRLDVADQAGFENEKTGEWEMHDIPGWKLDSGTVTERAVQANVELPIRKIGDVNDTSIPELIRSGPHSAQQEAKMFQAARVEANKIVDEVFVPTAFEVMEGKFEQSSIKLDKMRGVFTIALYQLAKTNEIGTTNYSKQALPVLPKAGWGDMIRSTFNDRDKAVLYTHTSDSKKYESLQKMLLDGAQTVRNEREFGKTLRLDTDIVQVGDNTTKKKGARDVLDSLILPGGKEGGQKKRYGSEKKGYGTIKKEEKGQSGSKTGKDIPVTYNYNEKSNGKMSKDPKIVLEFRDSKHNLPQMFANHRPTDDSTSIRDNSTYQKFINAIEYDSTDPIARKPKQPTGGKPNND